MAEKDSLGKKLSFLSSGSFDSDPFGEEATPSLTLQLENRVKETKDIEREIPKKKRKEDKFKKIMQESEEFLDRYSDGIIYEFDNYLEQNFVEDEDVNLRNNLIGLGRKYARTNQTDNETSEVSKAFTNNEKALADLYDDIQKDKSSLQKDIEVMRVMRTKNFKTLSEMVTAKATYHNTALSVIKEMNNIKKAQFDIQLKNQKRKAEEEGGEGNSGVATKAIQNLFSIGRDNILDSVGGYSTISGAIQDDVDIMANEEEDEMIQSKYFNELEETDGDKFLKYENRGVEYILLLDDHGDAQVIAEDSDGNVIPDYPMPSNIDDLHFDVSESTQTATDDLHRKYKVRHI